MLIHNILNLFFPKLCGACSKPIINPKDELCLRCEINLIYESHPNTREIQKALRGRIEVEKAAFFIDFTSQEGIQQILHSIKYQNQKKLAIYLAEQLAIKLGNEFFQAINSIIPVPLHPKKLKIRGFNQSDLIAKGIQNISSIPVDYNNLQRIEFTESQTNKNRLERWDNVNTAFELINKEALKGKHILLVDDVFTTGATLETCIKTLKNKVDCRYSIITLAKA